MKFIPAICLSLTMFFFDNCTVCSCKKVLCPAFNDTSFNRWFPYNTNNQIIFRNNSDADTFSFYVDRSADYETTQGCFGAHGGCIPYCHLYSNELYTLYDRKLQVTIYSATPKDILLNFYQFNCRATDITDTGLAVVDTSAHSNYHPSMNIGGNTFNSVQLITKDTAGGKISGPYKIFLEKNAGIIAYETYPDLKLWIKQ
jgi:hypothetical protein